MTAWLRAATVLSFALLAGVARAGAAPTVDVVVAHYNEDLAWVDRYRSPDVRFKVYSKGGAAQQGVYELLPNVGRESQTYLHHIIKNYDRLAPWTVFTQGSAPSWGYRSGDSKSGHLTDQIKFEDYLKLFHGGQDSVFAISAATHLPRGIQSTRIGILTDKLKNMSNGLCPSNGADGWSSWWFDAAHPHHKGGNDMIKFYHEHVLQQQAPPQPQPLTLGFVQGARFAVS